MSNFQWRAAIIRPISPAAALRELNKWKTESRLGCICTVAGTDAVFSVRKGTLEIRGSELFFDAETCKALMHPSNGEEYNLIEPVDVPLTLRQGFPPLSAPGLLVRFHNGDACFSKLNDSCWPSSAQLASATKRKRPFLPRSKAQVFAISAFRITIPPQGRPFMHLGIRRPGSCSGRLVGRRARTDC